MPSKRLRELRREVEELRRQFLPDPFHPLGKYSNRRRIHAHARAFLVLSHAEVESFLEDCARDLAKSSEALWLSRRRVTMPLAYLLWSLADRQNVPTASSSAAMKDVPQRLVDASVKLFHRYYKCINDNNGIKEENLLALYSPLGLPVAACGATLIPNLDSLGTLRGRHAHHSAKAVVSILDPETEYLRVKNVLNDLIELDDWIRDYKRRVR